jgi:hypothetical protein
VEAKQWWLVFAWVTKKLLSRAPPCFGSHVKPLVPAAFAIISTHQFALGPRGELWSVLDINKLMMMKEEECRLHLLFEDLLLDYLKLKLVISF